MKNQLKLGVMISYVTIFMGLLVSLFYTPFMLRTVGESQYGLYTLVASIVGYLGLLNFGFSSSYMRYYAKYKTKNDNHSIMKLNGMFLIIFSFLSCIILLVGFLVIPNLNIILGDKIIGHELSLAKTLFLIMLLNLALPLVTTVFNVFVIAHERFIFIKVIALVKTLINPLFMVPVLLLGYETMGMSLVTLFINLVFEFMILIYAYKKLKIRFMFKNFDFKLMKEMAVFSTFVFMNMIIDQVNWSVDKFLLGRYQGTVAVAIYGVASQINSYYLMFSTQVSTVFTPRVNYIVANGCDKHKLTDLFTRIGRLQFYILGLILIGFYGFGEQFIVAWAGEGYREAYFVILILISTVTIPLIQNTGIEIQRAMNMHKFRSIVYFMIAIGNVMISIPLIQRFGPVGAAIGTGIALLLGNGIIMNWYYSKYIGLNIKQFWINILNIAIIMMIPFVMVLIMKNSLDFSNLYLYLVSGCMFVLVYCGSMWFLAMNKDEKLLIQKPIQKIYQKIKARSVVS